jgi:hypothetical protein
MVFYRPIEAAIRWSGLLPFESRILRALGSRSTPSPGEFKRWPELRLNCERIFDGVVNGDLPYGRLGVTCRDTGLLSSPELTVRHVDLKTWMTRCYPDQRPDFLFDTLERQLHPAITVAAMQALLIERDAIQGLYQQLHREHESLRKEVAKTAPTDQPLGPRSEATYLNIVGGLVSLLLGQSPNGKPYSSFRTMESVISALLAHFDGHPGIAERTLWQKLGAAKRHIDTAPR